MPGLVLERPVYLRETADGLFRPIVYLGHKIGEEVRMRVRIPPTLILSVGMHDQLSFSDRLMRSNQSSTVFAVQ